METLLFNPSFPFLGKLEGRLTPCLGHPCPAEQPEGLWGAQPAADGCFHGELENAWVWRGTWS